MSKNLRPYAFVWVTSLAPAFCAYADNAETANKSNYLLNLVRTTATAPASAA
ncbi:MULTISPECIES: hypothetical protein [unclassified Pseudomonas]|uniref:hypothetical protein n=1 Tax=unclassified Pseudomonas TaxID=196821 RepID=UPI001304EDF8|nr:MULTISPECIES: hypothetical protein [unclassified Pseudomonas]